VAVLVVAVEDVVADGALGVAPGVAAIRIDGAVAK
jgi:hypothetical protein